MTGKEIGAWMKTQVYKRRVLLAIIFIIVSIAMYFLTKSLPTDHPIYWLAQILIVFSTAIAIDFLYNKLFKKDDREVFIKQVEEIFSESEILKEVQNLKNSIKSDTKLNLFETKEKFDDYLKERLKDAKQVKVIHMSSESESSEGEVEKKKYLKIIEEFVKSGKIFQRILCANNNDKITKWIKDDLDQYKNYKYYVYYMNKARVNDIRILGFMIIDEDEVCLGGGYKKIIENPTISIRNSKITKFFSDFFHELLTESTKLTSENIDDLVKEPFTILSQHSKIYEVSADFVKRSKSHIWGTGFTPNKENSDFDKAIDTRLEEQEANASDNLKDMEFKFAFTTRAEDSINKSKTKFKQKENSRKGKFLERVVLDKLYHLDVLIRDDEEMLIGIPSKEGLQGYSFSLWIKKPEIVRQFADWFNVHVWNKSTEIIGKDGLNEENIKYIKEQLAKKQPGQKE